MDTLQASYRVMHQNRGAQPGAHYFDSFYYIEYMGQEITWANEGNGIYVGTKPDGDFDDVKVSCIISTDIPGIERKEVTPVISGNKCTVDTGILMPEDPPHLIDMMIYFNK